MFEPWITFLIEIQDESWYDPTDSNGDEKLLKKFYEWLKEKGY